MVHDRARGLRVLVGCGRMAWEQRADAGRDVLRSIAVYVAVSGAGVSVIALAVSASDQFSTWIISQSVHGAFGVQLTALLGLTAASGGFGAILVIILGLLALLASLLQILLMVVRGGMLVILTGILPTTAAFTGTQAGRQWFRKSISWLIAFILYKPAAADRVRDRVPARQLQRVRVRRAAQRDHRPVASMLLALLALPALMRFVTPMVGAVAAGGAGTILAAGGAAAVAMPSGALRSVAAHLGGGSTGGGSNGGSGPQGSTGAPGGGGGMPGGGGAGNGGGGGRGGSLAGPLELTGAGAASGPPAAAATGAGSRAAGGSAAGEAVGATGGASEQATGGGDPGGSGPPGSRWRWWRCVGCCGGGDRCCRGGFAWRERRGRAGRRSTAGLV